MRPGKRIGLRRSPDDTLLNAAVRPCYSGSDDALVLLAANSVTYAGPPDRPSDAWRLVDAGSPLPRVGRPRTAASVPGTGSPAGAASRVGPGDLNLCGQLAGQHLTVEHLIVFVPATTQRGIARVRTNDTAVIELIRQAGRIAALTGAGVSTAAGIPDFRGPRGLYVTRQYDPERTFDIGHFDRDPTYFFTFARDFVQLVERVQPTLTHRFLATLEARGQLDAVITQNIDGLHQKAGSRRVLEVHGSVRNGHCRVCGNTYGYEALKAKLLAENIARCDACGGVVKPDIVFFGEAVQDMEESSQAAARADLFLVIGSSLTVYPAALLPQCASGQVVVVNQGAVEMASADWLRVNEAADSFFARVATALDLPRLVQTDRGGSSPEPK